MKATSTTDIDTRPFASGDDGGTDPFRSERGTLAAGCLLTIGSALITCLMLFINGSLVMAVLIALTRLGPPWLRNTTFMQFTLFSMPVILAVLQWMMIDYVRTRIFVSSRRNRDLPTS